MKSSTSGGLIYKTKQRISLKIGVFCSNWELCGSQFGETGGVIVHVVANGDENGRSELEQKRREEEEEGVEIEDSELEAEEKEDSKEVIDPVDLQTWKLVTGRPKRQSIVPKRFEHSPKKRRLNFSTFGGGVSRESSQSNKRQQRKQDEKSVERRENVDGSKDSAAAEVKVTNGGIDSDVHIQQLV